jgi:eukaryotic-like serine/threonine-protein kinase
MWQKNHSRFRLNIDKKSETLAGMSITGALPPEYVSHLKRQGFALTQVLGSGLCGSVYLAEQQSLNRKVAVKFFDSAFVRSDAAMQKRFVREAKLLARFQHPNIPFVLTEGVLQAKFGAVPYFVMEYVHGSTLRDLLREKGTLDQRTSVDIAAQVLDALTYAHAHQIVHRDVKPANVMIDSRQRCFLIDFSIGVSFEHQPGVTRATVQGEILGSPPYTSPEQMRDASSVDGRTDVYSVGVMLVEMLSGRADITNISRALAALPRNLVDSIERACVTDISLRHKTADDFLRSIGGRHQLTPPTLSPALALCANTKCSGANWSSRGYYRGPRLIQDSTGSYCTSCGSSLLYHCRNCGVPIADTHFCGNCGTEIYKIPECKVCGSWLTLKFMDSMGATGCSKCKGKKKNASPSAAPASTFDDDIPF